MGDIAFLLIIFFMVTSVFIKEAHVDVTLPKSQDIAKIHDGQVTVSMDGEGVVWVQGRPCALGDVEALVSGELEARAENLVMLKIDENMRHEQFSPLLSALSATAAQLAWIGEQE
jgi:biopolymer transport protein ExbD